MKLRSQTLSVVAVIFMLAVSCSETSDQVIKTNSAGGVDEHKSNNVEWEAPKFVRITVLDYSQKDDLEKDELYDYCVPVEALRVKHPNELKDYKTGYRKSIRTSLVFGMEAKEISLRASLADKVSGTPIFVQFTGTDANYDERIRNAYDPSRPSSFMRDSGSALYNLREIHHYKSSNVPNSESEREYVIDDKEFGFIKIDCNSFNQIHRPKMENGNCSAALLFDHRLILRISFPFEQLKNWRELVSQTSKYIASWEC